MIELQFDAKEIRRILGPLHGFPKQVDKAVRSAIRRAAPAMAKEVGGQIKGHSFLQGGAIRAAITKPLYHAEGTGLSAEFRVASKPLAMDRFRLLPRKVTARKRVRSTNWPMSGYQIGPNEPVRTVKAHGGKSKGFVIRLNGKLFFMQRRGKHLNRVFGYAVQYFAAFGVTHRAAEARAREIFEKRLEHEVHYQLSKLA